MFNPQYEKLFLITDHITCNFHRCLFERNVHGVGMLLNIKEIFLYIQISRQRDSSWLKLLLIHVLLISTVHLISIINVQTAVGTG